MEPGEKAIYIAFLEEWAEANKKAQQSSKGGR